jgi:hypothetical protein
MTSDAYPVQWTGRQAIVALPEHIGRSNAGLIREELLSVADPKGGSDKVKAPSAGLASAGGHGLMRELTSIRVTTGTPRLPATVGGGVCRQRRSG